MTIKIGVVMDPIQSIKPKKDSSLAMLLAAQRRGWQLYYMQQQDLSVRDGKLHLRAQTVTVKDDPNNWFEYERLDSGPCVLSLVLELPQPQIVNFFEL